jgi:hypothetical protein
VAVRRDLRKSMTIHADPVMARFCTWPAQLITTTRTARISDSGRERQTPEATKRRENVRVSILNICMYAARGPERESWPSGMRDNLDGTAVAGGNRAIFLCACDLGKHNPLVSHSIPDSMFVRIATCPSRRILPCNPVNFHAWSSSRFWFARRVRGNSPS